MGEQHFGKIRFVIIQYSEKAPNLKFFKEHNLLSKVKETSSGEQKKGGRKTKAMTSGNEELVEKLIWSKEDLPGTHYSIRKIFAALSAFKTFWLLCTVIIKIYNKRRFFIEMWGF